MGVKILHSEVLRCRTDVGRRRRGGGNCSGRSEDLEQTPGFTPAPNVGAKQRARARVRVRARALVSTSECLEFSGSCFILVIYCVKKPAQATRCNLLH